MKPNIQRAALRCENVALACETVTTSVTLAGTDMREHAEDIRLLIAEALAMAEVRKALYGEVADSDALMADPAESIRERAEAYKQQSNDLARASSFIRKIEEGDASFKRLADRELVIIASMPLWEKDIHETLSDAVQRTVNKFEADLASRDALLGVLKSGIRNVGEQLHEITAYADNEKTMSIAHGLYDAINTMLACTPAEAGEEVERLRAVEISAFAALKGEPHKTNPVSANIAHLRAQLATAEARVTELERKHEDEMSDVIAERDGAEDVIVELCQAIGWTPEWTSAYSFDDAVREAQERILAIRQAGGFNLIYHLYRQREFSSATFGPGERTAGNIAHIRKELLEIEANPRDLTEWIDVALLAFDGAWRHGGTPESICAALAAKQAKNETRTWPDWRTVPEGNAICHVETVSPN